MKRKIIPWLNIVVSPIIILIVYFSGHSILNDIILPCIDGILNPDIIQNISSTSAKIAVDTAILNLILNVIILKGLNLIKVTVNISNRDRTPQLFIPINREKTKIVEIKVQVDYKWNWIKKLIKILGGSVIEIYIPENINYQVKNKSDFNCHSLEDMNRPMYIALNLERALDIKESSKEMYLLLEVTAESEYLINKSIQTDFSIGSKVNIINKLIFIFMKFLFMDIVLDNHDIRGRNI